MTELVSVILATHNRAASLQRALTSIQRHLLTAKTAPNSAQRPDASPARAR